MSLRFYLFVSDVDQGIKVLYARGWVQRFSCLAQQMERTSLDLPRAVKKRYNLEVGCESV